MLPILAMTVLQHFSQPLPLPCSAAEGLCAPEPARAQGVSAAEAAAICRGLVPVETGRRQWRMDAASGVVCEFQPVDGCFVPLLPISDLTLEEEIKQILDAAPAGAWGVYIKNLKTDEILSIAGDSSFHPASTIKFPIAVGIYAWLDAHPNVTYDNGPQPGRNYQQLLTSMLVQSEELATSTLLNHLNRSARFRMLNLLRAWGLERTFVEPRQSTPQELGQLLEMVVEGELLSAPRREHLLQLMRLPSRGDDQRLGGALPQCASTWLAHKPGTTFESGLDVVADAGYLQVGELALVMVVIGNDVAWIDYQAAEQVIGDISSVTLSAYYRQLLSAK